MDCYRQSNCICHTIRSKAFSRLIVKVQCVAYARLSEAVSNKHIECLEKEFIKEQMA